MSTCRHCTHSRDAHEHLRAGSNCSQCACASFARDHLLALRTMVTPRKQRLVMAGSTPVDHSAAA